ncbi:hypothetical protein RDI58_010944 [Solanum bulbocastanum]|uniref:Uncharacterized protein n=1 Tax=Solanum bulbocastanum TaxID=147425 RepID=A0AAN8YJZ9_SOLBU
METRSSFKKGSMETGNTPMLGEYAIRNGERYMLMVVKLSGEANQDMLEWFGKHFKQVALTQCCVVIRDS